MFRPFAGSAFSPSNAATRAGPTGRSAGSTNSPGLATAPHSLRRMGQGDQAVRLPAPVRCVEPEDRGDLAPRAGQSAADVGKEILQAARGIGVGEELGRLGVVGVVPAPLVREHPGQIRRELGFGDPALKDVGSRGADIEDGRDGRVAGSLRFGFEGWRSACAKRSQDTGLEGQGSNHGGVCRSLSLMNETPDEPPGSNWGLSGVLLGSHSSSTPGQLCAFSAARPPGASVRSTTKTRLGEIESIHQGAPARGCSLVVE